MAEEALARIKEAEATLVETDFPKLVIVELIAGCNYRCPMCPYPDLERPNGVMEMDLFKKIAAEVAAKGPESQLWLAIMGEPTLLGSRLAEYVGVAKRLGVGEIILNTNGSKMTPELFILLHNAGLDVVIFGLDAVSAEAYSKIRVGGDHETVMAQVQTCLLLRQAQRWTSPKVVCQLIKQEANKDEVGEFIQYWTSRGAAVKVRTMQAWNNYADADALTLKPDSKERIPCPWLIRTVSIHNDGKIVQCDSDYEGHYPAGNIRDTTIEEAWNGELKRRRAKHWAKDFTLDPCKDCRDWEAGISDWYLPEDPTKPVKTSELKR